MPLQHLAEQMTWLDWAVLGLLAVFIASGVQRGLMLGLIDLAGVVVSLTVAVMLYQPTAQRLGALLSLPISLLSVVGFLALALLAQVLYALIINGVFHVTWRLWGSLSGLTLVDRALGSVPGVVKGTVLATILLLPFALFPIVPPMSASIERSVVASRLVGLAMEQVPRVDALVGRDIVDGLQFLAPPQTDEGRIINFGALGQLAPDSQAEERMLDLLNREREKAGLRPFQADPALRDVARAHSRDMFERGYFAHSSPQTGSPFDRMRRAGIRFLVAGENLAYAPTVQIAHEGLMNSPGHRANILRAEFGKVGIGAVKSDFRGSMFSQEFTN